MLAKIITINNNIATIRRIRDTAINTDEELAFSMLQESKTKYKFNRFGQSSSSYHSQSIVFADRTEVTVVPEDAVMVCMADDVVMHIALSDIASVKGDDVAIFVVGITVSPFPNMCLNSMKFTYRHSF